MKSIKWLSTRDIENFIEKFADEYTKTAFLGVFPINHLPRIVTRFPVLFIINTNTSNLPGQHWKAVYVSKSQNGEVFDSLAMPVGLKLQQWMNRYSKKWITSKLTLQNPLSPTCGAYVIYFVMTRLHHPSLTSCIEHFSSNVVENDKVVEKFFNQMFK